MFNRKKEKIEELGEQLRLAESVVRYVHKQNRLLLNKLRASQISRSASALEKELDGMKKQRRGLIEYAKKLRLENRELKKSVEVFSRNMEALSVSLEQAQHDYLELVPQYNYLCGKAEMYEKIVGSASADSGKAEKKDED